MTDPATPTDTAAAVSDPTVPDPAVSDVHGGITAGDLADYYASTATELAVHCHDLDVRPTSMYLTSWLYGFRGATVGFGEADTASVDALAAIYDLPMDSGAARGLYQRSGEATVGGIAVRVEVFCRDPKAPLAELVEVVPETPPVPAQAAAPTAATVVPA